MTGTGSRRASALLLCGVFAGLALAGLSLVERKADARAALGDELVAQVNHVGLSRESYETQVEGLAGDKRNPLTEQDRAHVLERMIEEELLIQRGVEIGLVERNRPVRAAIADAMISAVTAETEALAVSDEELRAYYDANQAYFSRSPQLHVATIRLKQDADPDAVRAALAEGIGFAEARDRFGAPQIVSPPNALLPLSKLRDYIGPGLLQVALEAPLGTLTGPVDSGSSRWLIVVVDRFYADVPPFETIRDTVEQAWRKERGDQALRDYLDWLKARAHLVRAP